MMKLKAKAEVEKCKKVAKVLQDEADSIRLWDKMGLTVSIKKPEELAGIYELAACGVRAVGQEYAKRLPWLDRWGAFWLGFWLCLVIEKFFEAYGE